MADPNQTPQRTKWVCPCNGCKKAQKVIIDQVIEDYKSCPNVIEDEDNLYCYTYYRHDDCVRIMDLLYKITKDDKYTLPKIREEVAEALDKMLSDPNTVDILRRLED